MLLLINLNLDNTLSPSSPWYWPRVVALYVLLYYDYVLTKHCSGREYLSLDSAVLRVLSSGLQAAVLYFVNRIYAKVSQILITVCLLTRSLVLVFTDQVGRLVNRGGVFEFVCT